MSDKHEKPAGVATANPQPASVVDSIFRLTSKGPTWLKALGFLVVLVIVVAPYVGPSLSAYFAQRKATETNKSTDPKLSNPAQYGSAGVAVTPPQNYMQTASDGLSPEDLDHLNKVHYANEEMPPFHPLWSNGTNDQVNYQIFPSDECIRVDHIRNGQTTRALIRGDAQAPHVSAGSAKPASAVQGAKDGIRLVRARKLDAVLQSLQDRSDSPHASPVQGTCLNPHPGTFQYWNTGVNQCLIQVFRRFADGCTHYQFYNPCNQQWDPQIHWTYCNAQHRW